MIGGERGFSDVLEDLLRNFERMVRAEVRLAKSELQEEVVKAKVAALLLTGGAVFGMAALGGALVAAIAALAVVMPTWAAALTVSGGCVVLAIVLLLTGLNRLTHIDPVPDRAIDRPKEDLQWVKQHAK